MEAIKEILKEKDLKKRVYAKHEFQDFGFRLAEQLNDIKRKSLYIKLAKEEDRRVLLDALEFVKGSRARNKARLFMWKLAKIRREKREGSNAS